MSRTKILGNTLTVWVCLLMLAVSNVWADGICRADIDFSGDVYPGDAMIMLAEWGREDCAPNGPAPVPKTGQFTCYKTNGDVRLCSGTGEDAEYQKGVTTTPRFTDHGNGTVTDNLTGLIWTKDAQQILGQINWQAALDACNDLDYAGYDDWRLPNGNELNSLIDRGYYNPALPFGHPFTNVVSSYYWSSTTSAGYTDDAWGVSMYDGSVYYDVKTGYHYVWPVRGGQ